MSGIYGFMSYDDKGINLNNLQRWNSMYGRERKEIRRGDGWAVGCCLEKISNQKSDEFIIYENKSRRCAFDTLLFNRQELINSLGEKDKGPENGISDEKLLLSYIMSKGIDALATVNGDFAGAIYDETKGKLFLFRNHLGNRPLYYYCDNGVVVFSTDIRGLVATPEVNADINEAWLYSTVAGRSYLSTTETEFANIQCVPPGGYVVFDKGADGITAETHIYWKVGTQKVKLLSEKKYQIRLREMITDSVKRRLDAVDGLIGAELSGGLDSGVIDILINRLGREAIYFSWSASTDELPLVEKDERKVIFDICEQEGIQCQFDQLKTQLGEDSTICKTLREMGLPVDVKDELEYRFYFLPTMNTIPICETAQYVAEKGGKAVFTGHGGDEGVSHRCSPYEMFYYHEYYRYFRHMWSLTHGQKRRVRKTLKKCYQDLVGNRKWYYGTFQSAFGAHQLILKEFADKYEMSQSKPLTFAYDPISYIRSGGSRNRLDMVAAYGAMNGVRYMAPYLDYRVVDYAVSIPRYLFLRGSRNRYIFREAFKDIMPESLYVLQNKRDESFASIEEEADWFEKFAEKKKIIVNHLDRKMWGKYFDYEVIDKWVRAPKPADEQEKMEQKSIYYGLLVCSIFDDLVKKLRG